MIGSIFITNIYLFIMAVVLAILEIQIEGEHGWAKNLPTWRPTSPKWYVRLYGKVMSGKEMTGYHLFMFSLVILIFHLPYVFGLTLTLEHWLKTLSLLFMFFVLWDFLWFVLNPHYPLKRFKKEHIDIHQKWFLKIPTDYWGGILISCLIVIFGSLVFGIGGLYEFWLLNFVLFSFQLLLVVLFTIYILKIDKWHQEK